MNFEKFFKIISFAAVFCGFLSLWVSGLFGLVGTVIFISVIVIAWQLEGTRWQISERLGTTLIVLALPVYYMASRFQVIDPVGNGVQIAAALGRLIITLTAIKLLQKKSDRDWIFLYLMAFFEVLLAAGLSISALYLASFLLYLLTMVCTVIAFDIRKTTRLITEQTSGMIRHAETPLFDDRSTARRVPGVAVGLIAVIVCIGLPLFFFLPRVSGAGFAGRSSGVSTRTGFSDVVRLGMIGTLQQNDEIVMRVRLEGTDTEQPDLYWRGVALDTFDGKSWSRSNLSKEAFARGDRDGIAVDLASGRSNIVEQTVYLEPLDTTVLFGLPKIVAIRTSLPLIYRDSYGGISSNRASERISYTVISDRSTPAIAELRNDLQKYPDSAERYLELPADLDRRIDELATQLTLDKPNRYDKAKSVEQFLQTRFGYTLEMKAGGEDPLADFLFNVREGHCEYFATAMAIMLRTQGIATRVVNGFHQGDFNETAGLYVVRQKNAHSWVEVYFPESRSWIKFDPTPPAGQTAPNSATGISGQINQYLEAIEAIWIQYFVAYDNREQRSLVRSFRSGLSDYQRNLSSYLDQAQTLLSQWWAEARGDFGGGQSLSAIGRGVGALASLIVTVLLVFWLARKIVQSKVWRRILDRIRARRPASVVDFYDRMLKILAGKGFVREPHQTPLEFAYGIGMPEAVRVTEKYNRVRFGEKYLSSVESDEIDQWLRNIETTDSHK